MDNHIFRSALSGFNRQDVMSYIEKTQKEASERALALETQINDLRSEAEQLRSRLESCTGERDALSSQLTDLTARFEQTEQELHGAQEKNGLLRSEVDTACAEKEALREKLQGMEQEVAAAREEKESVAQLELEARKRADALLEETRGHADEILAEANAQAEEMIRAAYDRAEEIRAAMETRVRTTGAEANELISSVETITAHVAAELRKMDVAVAQLPISFNHLKDGMKDILAQAEDRSLTEH